MASPGKKIGSAKTGGRKKGTPNKATVEVRSLAQDYGPDALKELHRLSREAASEAARVSACNAILERAYGKAPTSAPIVIDLPKTETAANVCEAMSKVIQSVAVGEITPADASSLCGLLESQRKIIELTELEVRIVAIEDRGQ
jgi:hypothetical protein